MIQDTLVLLKPDAVQRQICGEIISRFEKVGLKIVAMKMVHVERDFSKRHYKEHVEKEFYTGLENFIVEGPVLAMVLRGIESIELVRKMTGATEPKSSAPGTIRGDYSHVSYSYADQKNISIKNIIHASANLEDAGYEVPLWFDSSEIHDYKVVHEQHTL